MGKQEGAPERSSGPSRPSPHRSAHPALPSSTRDLEVEVTGTADGGNGRCLSTPGDAFLHAALASHLHSEGASCGVKGGSDEQTTHLPPPGLSVPSPGKSLTWDVLVSKFDVNDVGAGLRGAVGDFACAILHVLTVDVHLARAFDAQPQTPITWGEYKVPTSALRHPHHNCSPCPKLQKERPAPTVSSKENGALEGEG